MKLKLKKNSKENHQNLVWGVNWVSNNLLYSFSDDKTILTWDFNGDFQGKFMDLDGFYTAGEWSTTLKSGNELLAIGSEDGQIKIISKSGRIEKAVTNAHTSAIINIKWSPDGNTLATACEDGQVKTWSKQGELRSHLVKGNTAVYAMSWSGDGNFLLYSCHKNLHIEPVLKGGLKTLKWKAHDELILCADWNSSNKLIISGGEDRKFKVSFIIQIWDQYGRNLFISSLYNYVVNSVSWAPTGEYFAVGSYDTIRLCNKTGWTYSFNKVDSGGIMSMSWTSDGTILSAAAVSIYNYIG